MQKGTLFTIALGHFCVDSYATMLAPLLPLVIDRLGLSLASAGFLGTITSMCSLSQPLLGVWGDRMARRYLVIAGLLLACIFTPLLGVAPGYYTLLLVLCLGGVGVAAFHPQVFSLAGELSGPRRSFGIALFVFGGTLGLGLTPFWLPHYARDVGLQWLPMVSIPGLLLTLLIWHLVPLENPHVTPGDRTPLRESLRGVKGALVLITSIVILRSVTAIGFAFFLTVFARERGMDLVEGGVPLGVYNITGVCGALLFGYLGDRHNPKPLIWGTLLLAAPALYLYLQIDGWLSFVALGFAGAMVMASNSIMVAMAQELVPKSSGLASSLPLGFSWGIAGLTLGPIGHLADRMGVTAALTFLALLPLVPAMLALFLPARAKNASVEAGADGAT